MSGNLHTEVGAQGRSVVLGVDAPSYVFEDAELAFYDEQRLIVTREPIGLFGTEYDYRAYGYEQIVDAGNSTQHEDDADASEELDGYNAMTRNVIGSVFDDGDAMSDEPRATDLYLWIMLDDSKTPELQLTYAWAPFDPSSQEIARVCQEADACLKRIEAIIENCDDAR